MFDDITGRVFGYEPPPQASRIMVPTHQVSDAVRLLTANRIPSSVLHSIGDHDDDERGRLTREGAD
jgi:hypothetical protein